jgi:hypothetical protein
MGPFALPLRPLSFAYTAEIVSGRGGGRGDCPGAVARGTSGSHMTKILDDKLGENKFKMWDAQFIQIYAYMFHSVSISQLQINDGEGGRLASNSSSLACHTSLFGSCSRSTK